TSFHSFVCALFPTLGIVQLKKAIVNISAETEIIANSIADALKRVQIEIESLKDVVFQNHTVLDMIIAQIKEACTLINASYCTYTDQSKQI
ncbi:MER34 protein, partial [Falcunculus frontatus]|nr:MER34 protein [Falcunculus frontatus]